MWISLFWSIMTQSRLTTIPINLFSLVVQHIQDQHSCKSFRIRKFRWTLAKPWSLSQLLAIWIAHLVVSWTLVHSDLLSPSSIQTLAGLEALQILIFQAILIFNSKIMYSKTLEVFAIQMEIVYANDLHTIEILFDIWLTVFRYKTFDKQFEMYNQILYLYCYGDCMRRMQ